MSQTKYQLQSLPKLVHPAHIGLAGISVEISSFFFSFWPGLHSTIYEFITGRVCNSHMVSIPDVYRQSAVNMLNRYLT